MTGQWMRVASLRVYVEECDEAVRHAEQANDDERRAWWAEEAIGARGALLEAEAA